MTNSTGAGATPARFGDRLGAIMTARGLTPTDVANMSRGTVDRSIIHRAIGSRRDVRISTVVALARSLGVSTDYLLGLAESPLPAAPVEHVSVPLLPAPPPEDAISPDASALWITVPGVVLQGRIPDYALWVPAEEGNIPGLDRGDILVVSRTAAPEERSLIVLRRGEGVCVRQYREIDGIILAETLAGDLERISQADVIGVGVWLCHWM